MPQGIESLGHRSLDRPGLEGLRDLLVDLPDALLVLGACAPFDESQRTRRILQERGDLSIVLCGWLPGQRSEPHDHGGSQCALRVLRGVATEARYEITPGGLARETERDQYLPGSVLVCDESEIQAAELAAAIADRLNDRDATQRKHRHQEIQA